MRKNIQTDNKFIETYVRLVKAGFSLKDAKRQAEIEVYKMSETYEQNT